MRELLRQLSAYSYALPISYSKVNTCLSCPRAFRLRYIEKVPASSPPHRATRLGKTMHGFMQTMMSRASVQTDFEALWTHMATACPDASPYKDIVKHVLAQLARMPGVKYCERVVGMNLFMQRDSRRKNAALYGVADLEIEEPGILRIYDYKTEEFSSAREAEVRKQLDLYAYMESMSPRRYRQIHTGCIYLKSGEFRPSAVYFEAEYPELAENVRQYISRYLETLNRGDSAPSLNGLCTYCEYRGSCVTWQHEEEALRAKEQGSQQ